MNSVYGFRPGWAWKVSTHQFSCLHTQTRSFFTVAGNRASCYVRHVIETLTAVAAVVCAVGSLAAAAGVLVVNGKLDRLTGRVGAVESTLQTLMVGLIGRSGAK